MRGVIRVAVAFLLAAVPHRVIAQPMNERERADFSWSMFSLSGVPVSLDAFRGRVVIVNSWATWCEPCVAELGSFAQLRNAVSDTGLVFVMVAPQRKEPVQAFVRRRRLTLPVFLERTPAPAVYRFEAVPTTWIIDRDGYIALRRRGAMRWDTPAMEAFVRTLLAQTPAGEHSRE